MNKQNALNRKFEKARDDVRLAERNGITGIAMAVLRSAMIASCKKTNYSIVSSNSSINQTTK